MREPPRFLIRHLRHQRLHGERRGMVRQVRICEPDILVVDDAYLDREAAAVRERLKRPAFVSGRCSTRFWRRTKPRRCWAACVQKADSGTLLVI
jgi:hypothetical protein